MSRYDWPAARGSDDRAASRQRWNLARDGAIGPEAIDTARQMRRLHEAAAADETLAPTGATALWQSIGPTTTVSGTFRNMPRTAGRVRDIQIDPTRRVYAASALGGLWYSANGGIDWEPVAPFAATLDRAAVTPAANTLACGAVQVRFADPGTPDPHAQDEVWVATGEPHGSQGPGLLGRPWESGVMGLYGGVGVLHAQGPVATTRAHPESDPWERQAQPRAGYDGLRGAGAFAIAADPDEPRRLVVATNRGLHAHDPAAAAGTDPWSLVVDNTWDTRPHSPGSGHLVVTDVAWVPGAGGGPSRLWVAIVQQGTPLTGLWRSDNGIAGPFNEVLLPGARDHGGNPTVEALGLAAAPGDPDVLYVLGSGPRMWRLDGEATVRAVFGLPAGLFGGNPSWYDLAIAVDPHEPRRFLIGGAGVGGLDEAALYRLTVPAATPAAGAAWHTDYVGGDQNDPRWVGSEVHPDVHRIRWVDIGGGGQVFVATDGGVYASARDGDRDSFGSRTSGMPVSEAGFIAPSPVSDGAVLIGCQDSGVQLRLGGTWRGVMPPGDGGGVAFDPGQPGRMLAQEMFSMWGDDGDELISPTIRTHRNPPFNTENDASRFYSNPAVQLRLDGTTQVAIGTTRVWYTEQWGLSRWDAAAGVWRRQWVTLPSGTDPRAGDAADTTTDNLPPGPIEQAILDHRPGIRALRWGSDHRLYALLPGAVHRLDRDPTTMRWTRTTIHTRPAMPAAGGPPAPAAGPNLPPNGILNDLAVHDVGAGTHGSFYLATSHPLEPVWWFDGTGTWHPCGLGVLPPPPPVPPGAPDGVRAPAYAIVVDPDHPETVYAGTAVGVWCGRLTPAAGGNPPKWDWSIFSTGLPEAAVQDLAIASWTLAPEASGSLRLMVAALQARGAWELDLDSPAVPVTYLRAHQYDTRRLRPAPMADPLFLPAHPERDWTFDWALRRNRDHRTPAGQPADHPDGTAAGALLWHASPDLRLRPAPGAPAPQPADLPWVAPGPGDRFQLWTLQTALHAIDERLVANGRWTPAFERRLRAIRVARNLADAARVDADLWNHPDVQAGFWADAWASGGPTEADLVERMVGMATPRPGGVLAAARSAASVAIPAASARAEVCVHRRGIDEAPAAQVSVLLLMRPLPTGQPPDPGPPGWGALPVPALPGLEAAMDAVGPSGGPLPSGVGPPAPWIAADATAAIRRPGRAARTADAAVVTFEVDFGGRAGAWLLLAVVHHGAGTPDLASAAALEDLVRRSPHAAARSLDAV